MQVLGVSNVSKNFGYGSLFENVSFSLNEGEKISVVGANGCGKSTLLKMLAGLEKTDTGTISIKKGAKVAYLDQTAPDKKDARLVIDVLRDSFSDVLEIQKNIDIVLSKLENETDTKEQEKLSKRYSNLFEEFSNAGGYDIETNIAMVSNNLGIANLLDKNYNTLSGGEKTLTHLAKSLL
ncbi:MAG: ATP-binding cassette domain-containing protein, partial [Firmicutes bacterium]|nr:ATP-binding cassette domain-containing protein [Bacillota bacterium]